MEDPGAPWKPCPASANSCAFVRDRLSTSIISDSAGISLYSDAVGGLLMNGKANRALCAYLAECAVATSNSSEATLQALPPD